MDAAAKPAKQKRLPGLEDAPIEELESAARDYASARDRRMMLLNEEVDLKDTLLRLMRANNKETYHHDGIEIRVVREAEKVKVKVSDDDED